MVGLQRISKSIVCHISPLTVGATHVVNIQVVLDVAHIDCLDHLFAKYGGH